MVHFFHIPSNAKGKLCQHMAISYGRNYYWLYKGGSSTRDMTARGVKSGRKAPQIKEYQNGT